MKTKLHLKLLGALCCFHFALLAQSIEPYIVQPFCFLQNEPATADVKIDAYDLNKLDIYPVLQSGESATVIYFSNTTYFDGAQVGLPEKYYGNYLNTYTSVHIYATLTNPTNKAYICKVNRYVLWNIYKNGTFVREVTSNKNIEKTVTPCFYSRPNLYLGTQLLQNGQNYALCAGQKIILNYTNSADFTNYSWSASTGVTYIVSGNKVELSLNANAATNNSISLQFGNASYSYSTKINLSLLKSASISISGPSEFSNTTTTLNYTSNYSGSTPVYGMKWVIPYGFSLSGGSITGQSVSIKPTNGNAGTLTLNYYDSQANICSTKSFSINPSACFGNYGQYDATRISNTVVSGDFDRDGKEDDIAAFYNYGNWTTALHVWKSDGTKLTYQGDNGWWKGTGYDATKIIAVVSGDFNRDGFKDDIAVFYDYGNWKTTIHVWTSTGTYFNSPTTAGWYTNSGYDATKIKGRVVSGDFDRDGYKDDIAAFYDYGAYSTNIHVWQSTGSSFSGPSTAGWYSTTTYAPTKITGRVVSGDFDRDGYEDDIAAFYDYGAYSTNIHVWQSTGSSFSGPTTAGWYSTTTYAPSNITNRVVSGDFDRDGYKDDITAFYDYGNNNTTAHVWQSTGSSFVGPATAGWWKSSTYSAPRIASRVVSCDFNGDNVKDNIIAFYDYGNYAVSAFEWSSNGTSFNPTAVKWRICAAGTAKTDEEAETSDLETTIERNENTTERKLIVFPNPANQQVSVLIDGEFDNCQIKLLDISGKIIYNEPSVNQNQLTIDVSTLPSGVYFLQAITDNEILNSKLIISKDFE